VIARSRCRSVLLIAASLLVRSFVQMTRVDLGMDATGVLRFAWCSSRRTIRERRPSSSRR
jgi:hypothetical protein